MINIENYRITTNWVIMDKYLTDEIYLWKFDTEENILKIVYKDSLVYNILLECDIEEFLGDTLQEAFLIHQIKQICEVKDSLKKLNNI